MTVLERLTKISSSPFAFVFSFLSVNMLTFWEVFWEVKMLTVCLGGFLRGKNAHLLGGFLKGQNAHRLCRRSQKSDGFGPSPSSPGKGKAQAETEQENHHFKKITFNSFLSWSNHILRSKLESCRVKPLLASLLMWNVPKHKCPLSICFPLRCLLNSFLSVPSPCGWESGPLLLA